MKCLNEFTAMGRVTRDPELRYTTGGQPVCSLSIALNESYKADGEWKEISTFTDWNCWAEQAKYVAAKLKKGDYVWARGQYRTESWEKDGEKRLSPRFRLCELIIIGDTKKSTSEEMSKVKNVSKPAVEEDEEDEIPF